jgi:hypothetical protein
MDEPASVDIAHAAVDALLRVIAQRKSSSGSA